MEPIGQRREKNGREPGSEMLRFTLALVVTLFLGGLFGSVAAEAQEAAKVFRIGHLNTNVAANPHLLEAFRQGLRDLGYVAGRRLGASRRTWNPAW